MHRARYLGLGTQAEAGAAGEAAGDSRGGGRGPLYSKTPAAPELAEGISVEKV